MDIVKNKNNFKKKDGSIQKFKSFLLKIEDSVDIDDI